MYFYQMYQKYSEKTETKKQNVEYSLPLSITDSF